ncbi:sialate O-acetylesterase [Thalassoglobus polymorphus]|uniref:Carbohydrate acetyl esterase/feruloyl esterase n=1 Tax=Thalassoglobus polymorphus TaxID=2527994 RepID=A0A517QHS9_9PLAN|nr:sialate O-acetylesterase [Thalassoglobus polymorphus]QDT31107.1 Carbohydrate acetyl esterase/feruloyl esterase precursor [Thalassoglobus polymorphus]
MKPLSTLFAVAFSLLVISSNGPVRAEEAAIPEKKENFHLFLLVGQSNMAGRGKVTPQDQQPHPRVLTLNKKQEWAPAVDPLHFDKPGIVGVGIGKTFGAEIASDNPDVTIGLIPCGVGGSPISSWQPGEFYKPTKSHPWDDAMERAKVALKHGTLKGILWHQGESDSKEGLAEIHEEKLHDLIQRFRSELNAPNVPFIAGQMGQFSERPWNDAKKMVDAVHQNLPSKVKNTAFASSDGLKHKGDKVHFDADSYRELGRRYADAYRRLTQPNDAAVSQMPFRIERSIVEQGFDGKMCWVHARAGAIPSHSAGNAADDPLLVMTTQKLQLSGSDVFYALHSATSPSNQDKWSPLTEQEVFKRQTAEDGTEMTVCDFTPKWHAATGKLLGIGHTVVYENNRVKHVRPRASAYSVFDPQSRRWTKWKSLELPDLPKFKNAGAGSVQRVDLPNGDILLPIYFKVPGETQYSTTVLKCSFDGNNLTYLEHGSELTVPIKRGLYEPSIATFDGKFFLTMRNDDRGYVSTSDDGLKFSEPKVWAFDDGQELGNYNTQQHWVSHESGLYLVYTRKGADNDHVFRHRAPLFIARVNPETLQVIRATERVLVPEKGARLGNFGVTEVSSNESLVTVTEWMQPAGVDKHGSNNRIWIAKLLWDDEQ